MTGWRKLACLVAVVGLGFLATRLVHAQADKLEWKAFDGKPFFQILKTETKQTMKVQTMDVNQTQNQTFYIKWTPDKKDAQGNWVVTQEIIGVVMDINIGGNIIGYNSLDDKAPKNPMSDFFEALMKAKLKFTISPTFEVKAIVGRDEFIKNLSNTNPQMDALLRAILSEDALKQMAEPTWAAFPTDTKPSWEKKDQKLDLGPIGVYSFTNKYTRDEKDKDKIRIESNLAYSIQTDPKKKEGLPFTIKKGELKSKAPGTGYAVFDRAAGRFKESKIELGLAGKLTIDIGGMETEVDLDQTQVATVETKDTDPVEEAKKKK